MVYRHTPLASAMRSYSAGGSRATIGTIDDAKHMQESNKCQGMRGESWGRMEAPQNYGFTSVVADADEDSKTGMVKDAAEGFISFMGGNRSFPVMGVMDDRRHRLMDLAKDAAKGAVAIFGQKDWGQQFLNTKDGMFMTGNMEKKIRTALVKNKNGQQQQGGSGGSGAGSKMAGTFGVEIGTLADGGSSGSGSGGSDSKGQGEQKKGQSTLHKEESDTFHEISKDNHHLARGSGNVKIEDKSITTHYKDDKISTRVTDKHVHIRYQDFRIFVDEGGCWTTKPIQIKDDPDGRGARSSKPAVYQWDEANNTWIYNAALDVRGNLKVDGDLNVTGALVLNGYRIHVDDAGTVVATREP
jgi:phage gp45-like